MAKCKCTEKERIDNIAKVVDYNAAELNSAIQKLNCKHDEKIIKIYKNGRVGYMASCNHCKATFDLKKKIFSDSRGFSAKRIFNMYE